MSQKHHGKDAPGVVFKYWKCGASKSAIVPPARGNNTKKNKDLGKKRKKNNNKHKEIRRELQDATIGRRSLQNTSIIGDRSIERRIFQSLKRESGTLTRDRKRLTKL